MNKSDFMLYQTIVLFEPM